MCSYNIVLSSFCSFIYYLLFLFFFLLYLCGSCYPFILFKFIFCDEVKTCRIHITSMISLVHIWCIFFFFFLRLMIVYVACMFLPKLNKITHASRWQQLHDSRLSVPADMFIPNLIFGYFVVVLHRLCVSDPPSTCQNFEGKIVQIDL